jgi:hypothetical protein
MTTDKTQHRPTRAPAAAPARAALLTLAMITLAAGCDGPIREKSRQLATDLSTFRDLQSAKLAQVNASFDQSYRSSLALLEKAKADELRLDRDRDAQRIADAIVADTNGSLRTAFRDGLAGLIVEQRKRVVDADQSIEQARKRYADAYKQTDLALGKLDAVIDQLRILGREQDKLDQFYKFASAVEKVYRGLQDQQAESAADATPVKTPGPAPAPAAARPAPGAAPIQRIQIRNSVEQRATPASLK